MVYLKNYFKKRPHPKIPLGSSLNGNNGVSLNEPRNSPPNRPEFVELDKLTPLNFTLTIGLTGSGKSNINKIIRQKNIGNTKELLVDNYVTSNSSYKNQVNKIISSTTIQNETFYTNMEKAYFNTRQKGCEHFENNNILNKGRTTLIGSQLGCDKKFDYDMFLALKTNKNIIYETNCRKGFESISWIFNIVPRMYKIQLVFVLFNDLKVLSDRNIKRGTNSLNNYKKNKTKNAPRFPKADIDTFKTSFKLILDTIESSILYNEHPLHIIIYENNVPRGKDPILLYNSDSDNKEKANEIIQPYKKMIEKIKAEETQQTEIFSIHDTWVDGATLGDLDDLAAIFYLAKTYRDKRVIIYIVNDGKKHDDSYLSRVVEFNKEYGDKLRGLCEKLIIYGIDNSRFGKNFNILIKYPSNESNQTNSMMSAINSEQNKQEMYNFLDKSKKVVICAPVHSTKDKILHEYLNTKTIQNLYGQSLLSNGYNFKDIKTCDLTINKENVKNGINEIGINKIKVYDTNITNRRFKTEQLIEIVDDEKIVKRMMKYAIMKTIFLPPIESKPSFVLGLYVSNSEFKNDYEHTYDTGQNPGPYGAGTGNNAIGLIIFNKPEVSNYDIQKPHSVIETYFKDTQPETILNKSQFKSIKEYMDGVLKLNKDHLPINDLKDSTKTNEDTKIIIKRFENAMAYMCVCMEKWFPTSDKDPTLNTLLQKSNSIGSFSETQLYKEFDPFALEVNVSSPMWDLIAMHYIVKGIDPPKEQDEPMYVNELLETTDELASTTVWNDIQNALKAQQSTIPMGISIGGYSKKRKHRRKVTRRKPKTINKRMRHTRR